MPPGPGDGWGFPNNNPDHYGWIDYEDNLPLGADRTRPSIISLATSPFLRNKCSYRRTTTLSRRAANGIFRTSGREATTPGRPRAGVELAARFSLRRRAQ